jgi:hypothetical protein
MLGFIIFLLAMLVLAFCAAPPKMTDRVQNAFGRISHPGITRGIDAVVAPFVPTQ